MRRAAHFNQIQDIAITGPDYVPISFSRYKLLRTAFECFPNNKKSLAPPSLVYPLVGIEGFVNEGST